MSQPGDEPIGDQPSAVPPPPGSPPPAMPPSDQVPPAVPPPPPSDQVPPAVPPPSGPPPTSPPMAPPPVGGQAAYPASYPATAQQPPYDGFSIAGFVLALIGGALLGIIFGIIGLVRTSGGQRRGRGLAIAAIVISILWGIAIAAIFWFAVANSASRDSAGEVVTPGMESFEDVEVGDCLSDVTEGVEFNVTAVPCSQPHQGEVFAIYSLPDGPFPGETQVAADAESGCQERVPTALANSPQASNLNVFMYYPREGNWASGDREVICVAQSGTGDSLTGPLPN